MQPGSIYELAFCYVFAVEGGEEGGNDVDVGIFLPLSEAYKKRLYDYCTYGVVNIGKQDFLRLFEHA